MAGATISGTKYGDVTGNGFSCDDTGQGGVTIDLYRESNGTSGLQTGACGDSLSASTTTASNGTYASAGWRPERTTCKRSYRADMSRRAAAPTVRRGTRTTRSVPRGADFYGGNNFDDFQVPLHCGPSNVSFKVTVAGGSTTVTDLRGNTQQGDTVQADVHRACGNDRADSPW